MSAIYSRPPHGPQLSHDMNESNDSNDNEDMSDEDNVNNGCYEDSGDDNEPRLFLSTNTDAIDPYDERFYPGGQLMLVMTMSRKLANDSLWAMTNWTVCGFLDLVNPLMACDLC